MPNVVNLHRLWTFSPSQGHPGELIEFFRPEGQAVCLAQAKRSESASGVSAWVTGSEIALAGCGSAAKPPNRSRRVVWWRVVSQGDANTRKTRVGLPWARQTAGPSARQARTPQDRQKMGANARLLSAWSILQVTKPAAQSNVGNRAQ